MVQQYVKKEEGYYRFAIFNPDNVKTAFSIKPRSYKSDGSVFDEKSKENMKWLCRRLGVDFEKLAYLNQTHSADVFIKEGLAITHFPMDGFDALVSGEKGVSLAVFSADCLPVFFCDFKNSVIALAHAGWRGTSKKISKNVVDTLRNRFSIRAQDLTVGLGPSLRSCCYEVSAGFRELFGDSVIAKEDKYYFDLAKENIKQLEESGVKRENIYDSGLCTSCSNDLFFSYRKEGAKCGRTISLITLI